MARTTTKCVLEAIFWTLTALVLLVGLAFLIGGIILAKNSNSIGNLGNDMREAIVDYVQTVMPYSVQKAVYDKDKFGQMDISSLVESVVYAIIVFGVFFLIVATGGCCLHGSNGRWFLFTGYLLVWVAIAIVYVSVAASLPEIVEEQTREQLQTYKGFTDFSVPGVTWTGIMVYFQCCGADNYLDFEELEGWPDKKMDDVNLLAFIDNQDQMREAFKEAVENLNKKNSDPGLANLQDRDIDAIRLGVNLTTAQKALKERLENLPVYIKFKTLEIKLFTDKFVTPLACCKWVEGSKDPPGKLTEGCNLKGKADATNNNMHVSCLTALSEFFDGEEYFHASSNIKTIGYAVFGFISVYCIITALLTVLTFFDKKEKEKGPVGGPVDKPVGGPAGGPVRGSVSRPVRGSVSRPVRGSVSGSVGGPVGGPIGGSVRSASVAASVGGTVGGLVSGSVRAPSVSGPVGRPVSGSISESVGGPERSGSILPVDEPDNMSEEESVIQ